jgi:hypothetical protein
MDIGVSCLEIGRCHQIEILFREKTTDRVAHAQRQLACQRVDSFPNVVQVRHPVNSGELTPWVTKV